ncbi:MAG TPA: hypothetical protein VNT75_26350 [Symbiobacteriaceae bacterium]|nr:hypothetical protein [Symbiobacteriaceae bacterium]
MRKFIGWTLVLLALTVPVAGCGGSKKTAPVQVPSTSTPSAPAGTKAPDLPGDKAALQAALAEKSPVRYEIVLVEDTGGKDKDAYFDAMLEQKKWPEPSVMVLALFVKENYDYRFALGADFNTKKVDFNEILTLARNNYQPKAREGDPAAGAAALIKAVNQRMAQ